MDFKLCFQKKKKKKKKKLPSVHRAIILTHLKRILRSDHEI